MMTRFYHLTQLEQHGTDERWHIGLWEMDPQEHASVHNVEEAPEWAWSGISFYRSVNSNVLWVGVPEALTLEAAAETIAERLGFVEIAGEQQ